MKERTGTRQLRIFVSSTFQDMVEERNVLVEKVFPMVAAYCHKKQVEFTGVDLRWGITEEESERGETVDVCMSEIDRSRPLFMGMIGERYGWIPEGNPVSVTEQEILYGALEAPEDTEAFFYMRDADLTRQLCGSFEPDARLEDLRARIRAGRYPVLDGYRDLDSFGQRVYEDLLGAVDRLVKQTEEPDSVQEVRRDQFFLADRYAGAFVNRPAEEEKLRKTPVLGILAGWAASQLASAQEDRELDLKVTAYNIMTIVQGMIQCGILAETEGCLLRAAYVSLARRWGDAGMVDDVLNISPHILYDLTEPENENGRRRIKDPSDRIVRTMIGLIRAYHDENGLPSDLVYQCAEACLREAIRQYDSRKTDEMNLLVIDAASAACELLCDEKWFTDETLPTVGKRLQAMEKEVIKFEKYPFTMEIRIVMHHYHLARSVYCSRTGLGDPFDEAVNAAVHDQWIITASDTAEYQTLYCETAIRLARCMAAMHNRSVYEDGIFLIYNRVLAMIPAVLLFNTPYYHRMFVRLCIETGNTLVKGQGLLKEDMLEVSGNVFHIALITLDECMKKWKLPQAEQMLDAVWTGLETVYRKKGDKEHMIQAQQRKLARSQDMINTRKLILARLKRRPKNEIDAIESTLRHMI